MPKRKPMRQFSKDDQFWEARALQQKRAWEEVLKTKEGRMVLEEIMYEFAHKDLPSATFNDPIGVAFNEGGRSIGVAIEKRIKSIDINLFCVMLKAKHADDQLTQMRVDWEAEQPEPDED